VRDTKQTERTKQFFDEAASGWARRYALDSAVDSRRAIFLEAVRAKISAHANVLDFGCGSGTIASHLSENGYVLTGYDLSQPMIEEAKANDAAGHVNWIASAPSNSGKLPFPDAAFAAIVVSSVLEYVPDVNATLAELARVVMPGGWLFATVPDSRDAVRKREVWLQIAARMPGLAALLDNSRWREGAAYLRISVNRFALEVWQSRLEICGFESDPPPGSAGPLVLLSARKKI
jgi:ubiquinone/menaquinone biosynthesis C-methylase UbiE